MDLDTRAAVLSAEEQKRLYAFWNVMDNAQPVVRRLCSITSELRLHPDASHVDGMILFYRAVSEVSYGHAGTRGGVRRVFAGDFSPAMQANLVFCFGGARMFSEDTKVLLDYVFKQVKGAEAQNLVERLRETLQENDVLLNEASNKLQEFFGPERFRELQMQNMQSMVMQMPSRR